MMERQHQKLHMLPFKSAAGALLFSVILGPVGLLYSTVSGGVIMILLGIVVVSSKLLIPIILLWVISCIWSAAAINKYNNKLLTTLFEKEDRVD